MCYTYRWEKDEDFVSGLPDRTVQMILRREDVDALQLTEDYWAPPNLFLNLVPMLHSEGTARPSSSGKPELWEPNHRQEEIGRHSTNTGSEECFAIGTMWLKTCIENHTTCNRPRPENLRQWTPSRLVYVGRHVDDGVRLCEGQAIPAGVSYTTLSHCWGTTQQRETLTEKVLAKWTSMIPNIDLMLTFKDAIKVTRSLGVEYIWIDSLCILQDSRSDWLCESSLMSNVYKYSYCNIAATAAQDDDGGCFRDREPQIDLPVRFNFSRLVENLPEQLSTGELAAGTSGGLLEDIYDIQWERTWFFDLGLNSPLMKRAWVVQERLLTPRVLHFAQTQLYWECNELQASESYPNGMPREKYTKVGYKSNNPFNQVRTHSHGIDQRRQNFWIWGMIVHDYSSAKLTIESDKLVAISAVAREMKPLMNCQYLAGHWETDLIKQLGWPGYDISARPTTYRAPSWSWASVDGRNQFWSTMYSFDHYYALAEIVDTHIDLLDDDEMGPVVGGYLDVLGQVFQAELLEKTERHASGRPLRIQGLSTNLRFHQDGPETELEGILYCMPLSFSFAHGEKDISFSGLALQQFDVPNLYKRVGSVEPGIGEDLRVKDPFLGLLGTLEMDNEPRFSRGTSHMETFRLV